MPTFDGEATIEEFWRQRQAGTYFPQEWDGALDMAQAYEVQLGIMERRIAGGARLAGWKVGLTSAAMQQQFSVFEPAFGNILDDGPNNGPHPSGTRFTFNELIGPTVEHEMCFRLASDLRGPGIDAAQARLAIADVMPAIEVPETRGDFTRQLTLAVADNAQSKAIVTGEPTPLDKLDLTTLRVQVFVNDALAAEGRGDAVLGDPVNSLAWLANKLADFGYSLTAGQLIMAGSLTRQLPIARGDVVLARFDTLGDVSVTFA